MSGATKHFVERKIAGRKVLVFTKSNEADSNELRRIFSELSLPEGAHRKRFSTAHRLSFRSDVFEFVDIEKRQDARQLENYLRFLALTDRRKVSERNFSLWIETLRRSFSESVHLRRSTLLRIVVRVQQRQERRLSENHRQVNVELSSIWTRISSRRNDFSDRWK